MFIDRVVIEVRSGKGGDGAIAFLRDRNTAKGGPSGGNGGRGGSIFLRASSRVSTLINYRFSKTIIAKDGEKGGNKNKYGHKAEDVYCDVPVGTVVINEEDNSLLCDLKKDGQIFLVAKGGRGGRGNLCFKSNYNKTPRIAENGMPGETKRIVLELKLLADVGLVGFPSVGKSTFLSVVSKANPLIGDYDFTTIEPNLGVCYINKFENFVIADLPGLIEGAAKGRGLGFTFLRHIERCKVICHMISLDGRYDPIFAYKTIENELKEYGNNLEKKKRIIVCTKLDCDGATERFLKFKEEMLSQNVEQVYAISSLTHQNLDEVCKILYQTVLETNTNEEEVEENNEDHKIYTLKEEKEKFNIIKVKNNLFKICGETVEKTFKLINISSDEGMLRLLKYLDNLGVNEALKEKGAQNGDIVTLCGFEFEYFD